MLNRREFLKNTGLLGMAGGFLPSLLSADSNSSAFNDYKAIVVVYLNGGNDGVNTFVPIGSGNDEYGYNAYLKAREAIAVKNSNLDLQKYLNSNGYLDLSPNTSNPYYVKGGTEDNYTSGFYAHDKGYDKNGNALNLNFANKIGTHGYMPELANYVNQGKVAVIQNVGNLIEPTTRKDILDGKANLPPFLMAHDHQSNMAFNGNAHQISDFGLFGKLYDIWGKVNGDSIYGMNQSLFQTCHMMYGMKTHPLILGSGGIARFNINGGPADYYNLMSYYERQDMFKKYYNKIHKHAFDVSKLVNDDWQDYNTAFDGLVDSYGKELKNKTSDDDAYLAHGNVGKWDPTFLSAAKLIKIGYDKGLKRQIIYVRLASFDTHGRQKKVHGEHLRSLSVSLDKFQKVIDKAGLSDNVILFPISDFGRSVGANSDGSDHAWGSHLFVMGGPVKGGLYGEAPSLKLAGEDDMSNKGRLIPKISMAQYYNTILEWFGAEETTRTTLLPDLKNFDKNRWNLGFLS
jgi:uncharacterized protein (DUF1501 family)